MLNLVSTVEKWKMSHQKKKKQLKEKNKENNLTSAKLYKIIHKRKRDCISGMNVVVNHKQKLL